MAAADAPHPMSVRNGPAIAERLQQCTRYDAELDLAVETDDGRPAGYSRHRFDPVTRGGYVEPMLAECLSSDIPRPNAYCLPS